MDLLNGVGLMWRTKGRLARRKIRVPEHITVRINDKLAAKLVD